jgi:hypothetical protein
VKVYFSKLRCHPLKYHTICAVPYIIFCYILGRDMGEEKGERKRAEKQKTEKQIER